MLHSLCWRFPMHIISMLKAWQKTPRNMGLWTSLVAQLVKNLPAMQETPFQFLGQEDPLEKGQATHSSILGLSW